MPNVDYGSDDVAHLYAHTRGLPDAVLAGWGAAVNTFVPPRPEGDRVLDVGAGTGIFARAWPTWRPCQVVALEPSSAMRTQLVGAGLPDGVHVIVGRGEQVPIRALGITIAWLSAVVHHLDSLQATAAELRRVVVDDGVVLIRGLFAESPAPPGVQFIPGWERVVASYPSVTGIERALQHAGFAPIGRVEVPDHGPATTGEAANWVRHMRDADSMLGRFTDEEFEAGLQVLESRDPNEPVTSSTLTLLAFAGSVDPR